MRTSTTPFQEHAKCISFPLSGQRFLSLLKTHNTYQPSSMALPDNTYICTYVRLHIAREKEKCCKVSLLIKITSDLAASFLLARPYKRKLDCRRHGKPPRFLTVMEGGERNTCVGQEGLFMMEDRSNPSLDKPLSSRRPSSKATTPTGRSARSMMGTPASR